MDWWIWLAAGMLLLIAEQLTPGGFYLFFFGCGAITAAVAGALGLAGLPVQVAIFAVVSVVSLLLFRKPLVEWMQRRMPSRKIDGLEGEIGVLSETIEPGGRGAVELRGSTWQARNIGSLTLASGARCIVQGVDGLTLQIRGES